MCANVRYALTSGSPDIAVFTAMVMQDVKSLLSESREAFREVKSAEKSGNPPSAADLKKWKAVLKLSHEALRSLNLSMHAERARHACEKALLLSEVHEELISRESNAARTAERFRVLEQRNEGSLSTYDKALTAAGVIQGAIGKLSVVEAPLPNGARTLKRRADADAGARPEHSTAKKPR